MGTLYKKDTKGKVRYLKVWSEGDTIFNESGLLETDSPVVHTKVAKPKNVGKSNETTAEQQAKMEVKSYITKKLKEGYFTSLDDLESAKVVLPMLAKDYEKEKHKIDWNRAYAQPKLDGMRCLAFIVDGTVSLLSRKGVVIENMYHIEKSLLALYGDNNIILDGELYVHGEGFQTNMSYIKKYKKGFSERIKYHVYDIADEDLSQGIRIDALSKFPTDDNIVMVKSQKVASEEELKEFHSNAISEGYEGSMVRWGNTNYKNNGRSSNLLKYKDFLDTTATIIDVVPAKQRPEWGVPVFDGYSAGTRLTHEQRVDLLENKQDYIGKTAELRYFELTDDGVLRFPIMVGIRLDI